MTNQNATTYKSLFVTRANKLGNDIIKDIALGKDSLIYRACSELTNLPNDELVEKGYKFMFETNKKGEWIKKREFKNDTSAWKFIVENIVELSNYAKSDIAKNSKVNSPRGLVSKYNASIRPAVEKSQVGTSEEVAEVSEVAENSKRTKSETLKNFADIWLKEHNEDLLAMIEFAMSEEGAKISDYSVEQKSKVA
jgi:hypothetical protein